MVARAAVSKSISTGQGKARTDWQRAAEGGEGGEGRHGLRCIALGLAVVECNRAR